MFKLKFKVDIINIILLIIVLILLYWLISSIIGDVKYSANIMKENIRLSESKSDNDKLKKINSDIIGWIKLNDTNINFPILQTTDNVKYLTTSAYGKPAAYGAIFLDYRNNKNLSDIYSLIYGHHMTGGNMFGHIDKYKEKNFFETNTGGEISTMDKKYKALVVAYIEVPSANLLVYDPSIWNSTDYIERLKKIEYYAINIKEKEFNLLKEKTTKNNIKLVALITCTPYNQEKRSILLLKLI